MRTTIYKSTKKLFDLSYLLVRDNYYVATKYMTFASKIFSRNPVVNYLHVQGVSEYCIKNNITTIILEENIQRKIYKPSYNLNKNDDVNEYLSPQVYYANIKNVSVIGGNSFIIKDQFCLYDMFAHDKQNRFDLRFGSLLNYHKKKDEVAVMCNDSKTTYDQAIFLLGFGAHNYYHITIEIMSKFNYINNNDELRDIPILVDEVVFDIPQFKSILDLLNINNHEIIPVKKNYKYEIKELVYISECTWMPINVKGKNGLIDEDCMLSDSSIKYVRDTITEQIAIKTENLPKRVFLGRKSLQNKRLKNETEVATKFKEFGFEIVYPETMSFQEQVQLFSNAEIVAGTTGAALTNVIYCKPGARFICIIPEEYNFNIYSTIAFSLGIHSNFLDAKVVQKGQKISADQFTVDIDICDKFLRSLIE